jgi:hypothetical protein
LTLQAKDTQNRTILPWDQSIAGTSQSLEFGVSPGDGSDYHSAAYQSVSPHDAHNHTQQLMPDDATSSIEYSSSYGEKSALFNHVSSVDPKFPTDKICHRSLYHRMMQDYLDLLYPLVPVVHRPSFLLDLKNDRDTFDSGFLALVVGICAALVGAIPRKFYEYQDWVQPLRFSSRKEMIDCCYEVVFSLRMADYFDTPTLQKWASTYLLNIATYQLGRSNRTLMLLAEASQMARLLRLEDPGSYKDLSCIEIQLRKKAFWITLYSFV